MSKPTPLRKLRERCGLTLQEVADAVGTNTGVLSRIERGTPTSPDMAEKLVEYYGRRRINELQILYPERYQRRAA